MAVLVLSASQTTTSAPIASGLSVKEVQQLAGHQDLKTLERYVHLAPGALHAAIERLDRGRRVKRGDIGETLHPAAVSD